MFDIHAYPDADTSGLSQNQLQELAVKTWVRFFGMAALAFAQVRPLDNITSRQYQHEIRPCGSPWTAGCTSWGSTSWA